MGFFKYFMGARDKIPTPISPFIREQAPTFDRGLDAITVHPAADVASITVGIDYTDHEGQLSRRQITLKTVDSGQMTGFCHLREAVLPFQIDRVHRVIDPDDGTEMDTAELFRRLAIDPRTATGARPFSPQKACLPGLRVLVALAWADTGFDQAEMDQIMEYCEDACDLAGLDLDDQTYYDLGWMVLHLHPDWEDVALSLKILAPHRKARKLLHRYLNHVADADGVLDESETDFMIELDEIMAELA